MTSFDELARTDALLDALGRGDAAPAGDPLLAALAGWREDVASGGPGLLMASDHLAASGHAAAGDDHEPGAEPEFGAAPAAKALVGSGDTAAPSNASADGEAAAPGAAPARNGTPRRLPHARQAPGTLRRAAPAALPEKKDPRVGFRRPRSRRRLALAAAAVIVLAAGGAGVAASASARPGSALWPVTRLVYADRAASTLAETEAENSLNLATQALDTGRPEDASRHLADAEKWLSRVRSDGAVRRLRERTEDLRGRVGENGEGHADPRFVPTPTSTKKPVDKPGDNSKPTPKSTSGGAGTSGGGGGTGGGTSGGGDDGDKSGDGGDKKDDGKGGNKGAHPPTPKPTRHGGQELKDSRQR
ncbi:hypothetical protein Lfu02_18460 [Longispora fulva]|uniref:Putative membrane protein YgcG n=1 Tax=Longispora fulva TaxID=619741 RepID=A0A8J7KM77_9ACTN|nr:hypothetical protein [Longispora fulva]MBG6140149.1 putative membrane protein YgcG [Longispora fulva]GIG57474.1 hypothetical protein Lfu02_18460 [Longispora fulva]